MNRPVLAVVAAGLGLGGCASSLPRYAPMSPAESLDELARRAESVRTLTAECDVTLTDAAGESVRLDGAIAAALPDQLRLRAWKFGRAVFDITVTEGQTWMLSESPGSGRSPQGLSAMNRLPGAIALLGPEFFRTATLDEATERTLTFVGQAFDSAYAMCEIDRGTLTVRRLTFDETPAARSVLFRRYRVLDGVPWPTDLEFSGPEGVIALRLRDVRLNESLPEAAFIPPRRAVQQP